MSKNNATDIVSRNVVVSELSTNFWLEASWFLRSTPEKWLNLAEQALLEKEFQIEKRTMPSVLTATVTNTGYRNHLPEMLYKFSDERKAFRIMRYYGSYPR